jgi:hypothetical protein
MALFLATTSALVATSMMENDSLRFSPVAQLMGIDTTAMPVFSTSSTIRSPVSMVAPAESFDFSVPSSTEVSLNVPHYGTNNAEALVHDQTHAIRYLFDTG